MKPSLTDEIAPLSDLLRTLGEEARSCSVRVTDGEREGTLRFEQGELVEIVFGQLRGATAMFALMEASHVRYEVLGTPDPDTQEPQALEGAKGAADQELTASQELKLAIDEAAMRAWMEATDPGVPAHAAEAAPASQAEAFVSAQPALAAAAVPNAADAEALSAEATDVEHADTSAEGAPTPSVEVGAMAHEDPGVEAPQRGGPAPSDLTAAATSAQESLEPPADEAITQTSEEAEGALAAPTAFYEPEDDVPTRPLGPEREQALAPTEPIRLEAQEPADAQALAATSAQTLEPENAQALAATSAQPLELEDNDARAETKLPTREPEDALSEQSGPETQATEDDRPLVATSSQTPEAHASQPRARAPSDEPKGAANEQRSSSDSFAPKPVGARRSDWPRAERPRQRKLATSTLLGVGAAALLVALVFRPAREAVRTRTPAGDVTSGSANTLTHLGDPAQPTGAGAAAHGASAGLGEHEVPEWLEGPAPEAPQGALVPTIVLRVLVGTDGQVREAEVDSPRPALAELEQKALEIARSHRFRPAVRGGVPVEAWTTLPLSFDPSVVERTLVVQGSDVLTSSLGLSWAAAVERARPGLRVRREGFGSRGGLAALLRGHAELALATRPLDAAELALADKLGVSLRELLVGYDGVAVITHPDNPVRELDLATLAKIYTREVTQWSELQGASAPIRVLGKPSYAAASAYFEERVLAALGEQARISEDVEIVEGSEDVVSQVAADVHAIGYVSLSHVNSAVRALGLRRDAQAPAAVPSAATLRDGSYPLARPLLFYLRSDAGADARALVEVAFSKAGQAALMQHGLMPRPSGEPLSLEPAYAAAQVARSTPHSVYFQPGGALLAKGAWSKLRALGTALGDDKRALVVGNTDSTGSAEVNARIAERRARLVAAVLRQYSEEAPIEVENASSDQPLASNATEEGRTVNRRVDVFLMPR